MTGRYAQLLTKFTGIYNGAMALTLCDDEDDYLCQRIITFLPLHHHNLVIPSPGGGMIIHDLNEPVMANSTSTAYHITRSRVHLYPALPRVALFLPRAFSVLQRITFARHIISLSSARHDAPALLLVYRHRARRGDLEHSSSARTAALRRAACAFFVEDV